VSQYKMVRHEITNQDFPPIGQITYQTTNDLSMDAHVSVESIQMDGNIGVVP